MRQALLVWLLRRTWYRALLGGLGVCILLVGGADSSPAGDWSPRSRRLVEGVCLRSANLSAASHAEEVCTCVVDGLEKRHNARDLDDEVTAEEMAEIALPCWARRLATALPPEGSLWRSAERDHFTATFALFVGETAAHCLLLALEQQTAFGDVQDIPDEVWREKLLTCRREQVQVRE